MDNGCREASSKIQTEGLVDAWRGRRKRYAESAVLSWSGEGVGQVPIRLSLSRDHREGNSRDGNKGGGERHFADAEIGKDGYARKREINEKSR